MADEQMYFYFTGDCYYFLYDEEMVDIYYEEADAIIIEE